MQKQADHTLDHKGYGSRLTKLQTTYGPEHSQPGTINLYGPDYGQRGNINRKLG